MYGHEWGCGMLSYDCLNVSKWGDGLYKEGKCLSNLLQSDTHNMSIPFCANSWVHIWHLKNKSIVHAYICLSAFLTQTLTHAGRDAKGDAGGDSGGQCLFALSHALLSERNKSHVGDATWGLRVHPSPSSSSLPSVPQPTPTPPLSFLHLIRIPFKSGGVLLMFNNAGEPDANEPETSPVRSN